MRCICLSSRRILYTNLIENIHYSRASLSLSLSHKLAKRIAGPIAICRREAGNGKECYTIEWCIPVPINQMMAKNFRYPLHLPFFINSYFCHNSSGEWHGEQCALSHTRTSLRGIQTHMHTLNGPSFDSIQLLVFGGVQLPFNGSHDTYKNELK